MSTAKIDVEKRDKELEKENAELRQANEILKDALGFIGKYLEKQRRLSDVILFQVLKKNIV